MPLETAVTLTGVVFAFIAFAATLAWVDHRST